MWFLHQRISGKARHLLAQVMPSITICRWEELLSLFVIIVSDPWSPHVKGEMDSPNTTTPDWFSLVNLNYYYIFFESDIAWITWGDMILALIALLYRSIVWKDSVRNVTNEWYYSSIWSKKYWCHSEFVINTVKGYHQQQYISLAVTPVSKGHLWGA